jgi:hypothetical protein
VQRLLYVVILAIVLIELSLFASTNTAIPAGDADIRNTDATSNVSMTSNSSARATIATTMYSTDGE